MKDKIINIDPQVIIKWGFSREGLTKKLDDLPLKAKGREYINNYVKTFPEVKNLLLIGNPLSTFEFCSILAKNLVSHNKILRRISLIPFYELTEDTENIANRIITSDLVVISDLGSFQLNTIQMSRLYSNLWYPIVVQKQRFIFTAIDESDITNLNKSLSEIIIGESDALNLRSK